MTVNLVFFIFNHNFAAYLLINLFTTNFSQLVYFYVD